LLKKCANLNIKWRRRQIEKIALGIVSLTLVACAPIYPGPIGYTKADPVWGTKYGYTDKPIGKDEYSVVVTGNPKTSKERVVDIALLRAANIAKEQKRTHFVILNQISEELRTHEMVSAPLGGLLVWVPIAERETKEPFAVILVRLLPNDTSQLKNAFDATAVIEEVGTRVKDGDTT
jgi:hypothetical protein